MLGTNSEEQCRKILQKSHYETVRRLGKGSFGHVILASKFTNSVNFYAIKCISLKKCAKEQNLKRHISQQTQAMCSFNHANIVRLENSFSDCGYHFIIMQYCDMGNLMQYQAKMSQKVLSLSEALHILYQVMKGTQMIHDCNIIHRDLKCQNIFLKKNKNGGYTCKIGDFGFAKVVEQTTKTSCGTIYFMAPEVMNQKPYDKQADIWSLGVILYYMLFGEHPFKSLNILKQIEDKCEDGYDLLKFQNPSLKNKKQESQLVDFLKRIFCVDPKNRITLDEMFLHPLFQNSQNQETSDSTVDDQLEQDIQWELQRARFVRKVIRDVEKQQILDNSILLGFKFYLSKVVRSFLYQDHVEKFRKQQTKNKIAKQIEVLDGQLAKEMESIMKHLQKKKQDLKKIERFNEGFNLQVQDFTFFKQGYRNMVGKVYEEVHKKVPESYQRASLKFRVFCCHLINRVFKTGVKGEIFPHYQNWMKQGGKQSSQKVIDFRSFEEWVTQQKADNLLASADLINKIFYRKGD